VKNSIKVTTVNEVDEYNDMDSKQSKRFPNVDPQNLKVEHHNAYRNVKSHLGSNSQRGAYMTFTSTLKPNRGMTHNPQFLPTIIQTWISIWSILCITARYTTPECRFVST